MKKLTDLEKTVLKLAKYSFFPTQSSTKGRFLFTEEAKFSYPEFNPFRAVQTFVRVEIPALIGLENKTFTFNFSEGDINQI